MIIIEDGTDVSGANSYVSLAEARAYNDARGVILPIADTDASALVVKAFDYLETFSECFRGVRTYVMQETAWPRTGVTVGSDIYAATSIPLAIKNAQCYLAGLAMTVDLGAVKDTRAVTEEAIGPIIVKYSATQGATITPIIPKLDAMLGPFIRATGGGLTTVRL